MGLYTAIPETLNLERLKVRASRNQEYIDDIARNMSDGVQYPPINVIVDGQYEYLTDGEHRLLGSIKAGKRIQVNSKRGTREEAVQAACGANVDHGLRRTNADKREAVKLAMKTFPGKSDRNIAKICMVNHHLVNDVRIELNPEELPSVPETAENAPPTGGARGRTPTHTTRSGGKNGRLRLAQDAPVSTPAPGPRNATTKVSQKSRNECNAAMAKLVKALISVGLKNRLQNQLDDISVAIESL